MELDPKVMQKFAWDIFHLTSPSYTHNRRPFYFQKMDDKNISYAIWMKIQTIKPLEWRLADAT